MNAIFNRTSVRKYENKEVEAEKIDRILKAAMAAPSAANQRPWKFLWSKTKKHWPRWLTAVPMGDASRMLPWQLCRFIVRK